MIYIKKLGNGNVTLGGTVANDPMLASGFEPYNGAIPPIGEHQKYKLDVSDNLIVEDDHNSYSNDISNKIQYLLDKAAQSYRYNDMQSARAVAGIPLAGGESVAELKIYNEAVELAQWYLKMWGKASELEEAYLAGGTRLSIEDFINALPDLVMDGQVVDLTDPVNEP